MKQSPTLWRHPNFLRFWSANIISRFGSEITFLAMPIIAAVMLEATAVHTPASPGSALAAACCRAASFEP